MVSGQAKHPGSAASPHAALDRELGILCANATAQGWTVNAATTPSVSPGGCHIGPVPVNNAGIRVAGPRRFHLETSPLGTRPGGSPCDTSCQHDQRATDLLGWPSLVGLAARQLSRPLGKHDTVSY